MSDVPASIYRALELPVFQNRTYDSEASARACPVGDVTLAEDPATGLVRNVTFDPALLTYDEHYQNEQGLSPVFRAHLEQVSQIIERTMGTRAIVEIGCGKGLFLEMLLERGFDAFGFDPAYQGANPRAFKHFYRPGLVPPPDGLVLRHVLEHIQDPVSFLRGFTGPAGGGKVYIEVPCFDWICRHRAWFDMFYEHVNYFRLSDFQRMFGVVHAAGRFFGGQYLWVVAELSSLRVPERDRADPVTPPGDFLGNLLSVMPEKATASAIWGGASKGVIFSLLRQRAGNPVSLAVDINPAKQGRYLPGTGLRVFSPDEALAALPAGSTIFVMNSNYLDEIKQMSGNAYTYVPIDHE